MNVVHVDLFSKTKNIWRHTINEHETSGAIWMLRMLINFQNQRIFEDSQDNEHEPCGGAIWMLCMLINFQKWRIFEETHDKWEWT